MYSIYWISDISLCMYSIYWISDISLCLYSILGKPLTLECTQRCSSTAMTTEAEITIGLAEIVEALFDHRGATAATASLLGIHIPLEDILPEYSEVSLMLFIISCHANMCWTWNIKTWSLI